jgi:hypothetical protein
MRAGSRIRFRDNHRCPHVEAGFAAVDALVALVVLSTCLSLALAAAHAARRAGDVAAEYGQAQALLRYLVQTAPAMSNRAEGRSGALAWTREVSPTGGQSMRPRICRVQVELRGDKSRRRYRLATDRACPKAA